MFHVIACIRSKVHIDKIHKNHELLEISTYDTMRILLSTNVIYMLISAKHQLSRKTRGFTHFSVNCQNLARVVYRQATVPCIVFVLTNTNAWYYSIEIVASYKQQDYKYVYTRTMLIYMHIQIHNEFVVRCKWRSGSREFQLNLFGVCADGVAFVYRIL